MATETINSNNKSWSKFIVTLILFVLLFLATFIIAYSTGTKNKYLDVSSYEDCTSAYGAIILESYPSVCKLPNGKTFTQTVIFDNGETGGPQDNNQTSKNCITTGCNGEICQSDDKEPISTICLYRKEFECYKSAACEVQENGECGWSVTDSLIACLNNN